MELTVFDRAAASCDLLHFWISEDRLAWAHTSWCDLQSSEPSLRASLSLPDDIEDLDHLLVDDENYGNIQADAAETWDCSFIEAADWRKDRNGKKNVTAIRENKHMQLSHQ